MLKKLQSKPHLALHDMDRSQNKPLPNKRTADNASSASASLKSRLPGRSDKDKAQDKLDKAKAQAKLSADQAGQKIDSAVSPSCHIAPLLCADFLLSWDRSRRPRTPPKARKPSSAATGLTPPTRWTISGRTRAKSSPAPWRSSRRGRPSPRNGCLGCLAGNDNFTCFLFDPLLLLSSNGSPRPHNYKSGLLFLIPFMMF